MSHRIVSELFSASESIGPRSFIGKIRRPRGAKGEGVRFERAFGKSLGSALSGQWFEFFDENGKGYAQTDHLLFSTSAVYCIECKLGNIPSGRKQFSELYKPILEMVYQRPAYGIVCARYVSEDSEPKLIQHSLTAALAASHSRITTLQWRERMPLALPPGLGPSYRHIRPATRIVA